MAVFETLRKDYSKYLQESLKSSDTAAFQKKCAERCPSEKDRKPAVDQALRDTLLILQSNKVTSNIRMFEVYIKFCIELCRKDVASPGIPVLLLSDIFDAMTLDKCEELFTYVENNVSVWKEDLFFGNCKNSLLRMCNDLLRRLSRSQQTVFCGRILLFLAKFFPFSERSGLNIVSEFNLENNTEFGEEKLQSEVEENEKMEVDDKDSEKKEEQEGENKNILNYTLYKKFWSLQDFFRNPNQCYNKGQWKIFSEYTSAVLDTFASFKLEDQKDCNIDQKDITMDGTPKETHYFAKYLTNEKLLELQLSDSNFRRFILLQFLIAFQYLNSTVKFKSDTHELKPEQVEWVNKTTEKVYTLLQETPPDGSSFCQAVKHILKREEYWNAWKNDGCPAFKRPHSEVTGNDEPKKTRKSRRRIGDIIKDAQAVGKFYLGNPDLTKLWNLAPNNLEACKAKERNFLPSLETYFDEAIAQLDPAAQVDEEYKKVNDGNFGWRALRLLARRSPHFFVHGNNPINKLPEYLTTMIKKIARDRPVDVKQENSTPTPPSSESVSQEDENSKSAENVEEKPKLNRISKEIVDKLADALKNDWTKLAEKCGYTKEEIDFFGKKATPLEQCKEMLVIWTEEDPEASIDNLKTILQSINLHEAVEILKS